MKHQGRTYRRILLTVAIVIVLIVVAVALAPALALFPLVLAVVIASHRIHGPPHVSRSSEAFLLPYAPRRPPQV